MADSIQEQLVNARRTQILEAAATVFSEKGFHPTTIKDVARAAGIADGTIYNYFENKSALLLGIFDQMRQSVVRDADLSQVRELDLRSFLKAYLGFPLMVFQTNNLALFKVVMSEIMVNPELRALYYEKILEPTLVMAEAQFQQWADRHPTTPVNVQLTVRTISGIVLGLIMQRLMGDPTLEMQWATLPDFLTDLILHGLETDST